MKNQRRTTEHKRFALRAVFACMLMLGVLLGCFAASAYTNVDGQVTIAWADLEVDENIAHENATGHYTKVYDGTTSVAANAIKFTDAFVSAGYNKPYAADTDVEIVIDTCTLSSANVGNVEMTVSFKLVKDGADYTEDACVAPAAITVPAEITAVPSWDAGKKVAWSDLVIANTNVNTNGFFKKQYDGTTAVDAALFSFAPSFDTTPFADEKVTIEFAGFALSGKNVNDKALLTVSFKLTKDGADYTEGFYTAPEAITVPAEITPVALTWDGGVINSTLSYKYGTSEYHFKNVDGTDKTLAQYIDAALRASMDVTGKVDENLVAVWSNVTASGSKDTALYVTLGANGNYVIDPIPVKLTISPITIDTVEWSVPNGKFDSGFIYGNENVHNIIVTVTDTSGGVWTQRAKYQEKIDGVWVDVDKISANVKGEYRVYVPYDFSNIVEYDDYKCFRDITIIKAKYKVEMKDVSYVGEKDQTSGDNRPKYFVAVSGKGMEVPTEILNQIIYVDGNGEPFNGTFEYGMTEITAFLPKSDNYEFINANNKTITKLDATIWLNRLYLPAGVEKDGIDVIIWGDGLGFDPNMKVEVTKPEIDKNVLRGYPIHSEFTLTLNGDITGDEQFILLIPHNEKLYNKNASPLTVDDLYVYEAATGKLVKVNEHENYGVTLEDGYFKVTGYNGAAPITFVIAPTYETPFWLSALGIALIVIIILSIFAILFIIGVKLRRIAAARRANAPTVLDSEGERYEGEVVALEGVVAPIVDLDELKIPEEEETVDEEAEARTRDAVEDTLEELTNEAAQIELPREDLSLADDATNALAQKLADDLNETVEADDGKNDDDDADEVKAAVAEAMSQAFNESADATDAVEVVVEEEPEAVEVVAVVDEDSDDDDDDDDDDDNDESFGFNTAGLKFIDVKAEADAYNEMLEQERDGLIKIVYRYRRSFTSRMTQSQGNVQDYYSAIKNLLLSYKGIKGRVSWNYEAFNRGRTHVAKINAKTKTLYLYLALNPEELADTKYGAIDMSSKKKYASVPVLMKIKGDRKFKYALELIEKLCGENLTLKQLEGLVETDYRMPYKTTEELIEDGVIKMFAAAISMAPVEEKPVVEEAPAEEAPATEAPADDQNA